MTLYGQNVTGAGYCPRCRWSIESHPVNPEDGDVDRCPDQDWEIGRYARSKRCRCPNDNCRDGHICGGAA